MSKSDNSQLSNRPQIDRFKEAARELGCDEKEAAFDEKIKAIVKAKSENKKPDTHEK